MAKIFHELLRVNEAIGAIEKAYGEIKPLGEEYVDIDNSLGRVVSRDLLAKIDSPPFDRSEVDGYAVNHEDIINAEEDRPVKLKVAGKIGIGYIPKNSIEKGECFEISTGAAIPPGCTAVVMVEYTKRIDDFVYIYRPAGIGENISQAGSDIVMGDLIIKKGTVIGPREIGVLAAVGYKEIPVYKKVRIGLISTGNEIVEAGGILTEGKVYDVDSHNIGAYLKNIGADVKFYGIFEDDFEKIKNAVKRAMDENDVVITSGSTSAGFGDMIYRVFEEFGDPGIVVHGLKTKPGKPTVVAISNKKILIGLPGFPLSSTIAYFVLVKKIIERMTGIMTDFSTIKAKLSIRYNSNRMVEEYVPVTIVTGKKGYRVYPIVAPSGSISPIMYADGIMRIPENVNYIDENEDVEVILLNEKIELPDLVVIGSHDPVLDEILSKIKNVKEIRVGSTAGWYAVRNGEADLAGTHLLDENTNIYNIPYLEKFSLKGNAVIVRGYARDQVIMVKKGNPKNIRSIEDFLRDDVRIINRTKGSGTRTLFDLKLKELASKLNMDFDEIVKKIKGYNYEGKTHTSVAAAVAQGRADAGIGLLYYAELYNLDYIPIGQEIYDFLIKKESLEKKGVEFLIENLRSPEFKRILEEKYKGYRIIDNSGKIFE